MRTNVSSLAAVLFVGVALAAPACGGDDDRVGPGMDGGGVGPGVDGGGVPGTDGGTPRRDGECVPTIEICGDRMDQNCDGRDTSCGDNDGDGIEACRAGDDLTRCDCDDDRADVRPPFGTTTSGAPELCDGLDNDCNGRIDESAACCAGCASLSDRSRADICTLDGTCVCSTGSGTGPCAEGETCCSSGCVNVQTDFSNCGFCGTQCTPSSDHCEAAECRCGAGPVCDLVYECVGGSCG